MSTLLLAFTLTVQLAGVESVQSADTTPSPFEAATTPSAGRPAGWYGGQVIFVDLLVLVAAAVAVMRDDANIAKGAVGLALLGAPSVHLLHGNPTSAGKSFGMRLLSPLAFGLVGALVGVLVPSSGNEQYESLGHMAFGATVGAALGYLGATSLDAARFSPAVVGVAPAERLPFEQGAGLRVVVRVGF